jgi:hypothetical protein
MEQADFLRDVLGTFQSGADVRTEKQYERRVHWPQCTPRFWVIPTTVGLGLARMFELATEPQRPLLKIVYTMNEVFAALGIQSPHFEALE